MIYTHISQLIGNTPVLQINPDIHGFSNIDLYAKLDLFNPFGSIKDRIAKEMLDRVIDDAVSGNKTVIESSSGNTAKSLAVLAAVNGLKFKAFTSRIRVPEVKYILQAIGCEIEEFRGSVDCPDPNDPSSPLVVAAGLAKQYPDQYVYTEQYYNQANQDAHYKTTGKEIYDELGVVDYFFSFLGTCGSSSGVGKYLKERSTDTKVIGVVAAPGHHIPGGRNINELYEVGFFDNDFYSEIITGTTQEAIDGMLNLAWRSGVLAGATAGLLYTVSINYLQKVDEELEGTGRRKKAVFTVGDRLETYISYLQKNRPELFRENIDHAQFSVNSLTEDDVSCASTIIPEELYSNLSDYYIIDTRTSFAFKIGHIENSFNIVDEYLNDIIETGNCFPEDRGIVFVCRIGDTTKRYAAFLSKKGYKSCSLEGGIMDWKKKGLPLIK
jgi:cysteine synthase/rhodanese-related sulfurtransferase